MEQGDGDALGNRRAEQEGRRRGGRVEHGDRDARRTESEAQRKGVACRSSGVRAARQRTSGRGAESQRRKDVTTACRSSVSEVHAGGNANGAQSVGGPGRKCK